MTGSRTWDDHETIRRALEDVAEPGIELIVGDARGADQIAATVATELGWDVYVFGADWDRHGRAAGPIRNREMLDTQPDVVLAFQRDRSKGTQDTVDEATRRGIEVRIWSQI